MIADLEAHLVNLGDVLPGHEVLFVVHPAVGDEKSSLEPQVLEQRRDECSMGLHCVVEAQHDPLLAPLPVRAFFHSR